MIRLKKELATQILRTKDPLESLSKIEDVFIKNNIPTVGKIYSTGSTSRNTNVPNDSDFDYLIKIDRAIFFDVKNLETFKSKMKEKLGFIDGYNRIVQTLKEYLKTINISQVDTETKKR